MTDKWTINSGVAADTTFLKQTSPGVYTAEHASDPGSITTNIPISRSSFDYWSCDSVGTYNQSDESSCQSGWFDETWNLDLSKNPYRAKGTFEGFNVQGTVLASGTFTAYFVPATKAPTPTVSVSISPQSSTVAVGEKVSVTVTVKAGPVNLTSINLYDGLDLSPKGAAVVQAPPGLNGFTLAAFAVRRFVFGLTGAEPATVKMSAFATATSAPGRIHGSAEAQLSVGDISDYTVNLQASVPQGIVVDPSTAAHFNTTADNGPEGFPKESTISQAVKQIAVLAKEPEFPECLSAAEVAEDTEKHMESEWYSYYLGDTSLGKISVPLQWDETTQQVTLAGSLFVTQYNLTRVFKYRLGHQVVTEVTSPYNDREYKYTKVVYDDQVEECTETVPVKMLVAPVAGGDGLEVGTGTPDNAFTIVAAWEFPFAPLGAAVNPEPSWSERFQEKYGPSLDKVFGEGFYEKYKPYLSTTLWSVVFGFWLLVESGGLAALIRAPAAISKALTFLRLSQMSAETLAQLKETVAVAHTALEYGHTAKTTRELIEELFQILGFMEAENGPYPVMSAVIRGNFTTEYGHGAEDRKPYATLLGVSVQTTKFPNFWLTVSRKTQPAGAGSTVQPYNGVLPWPNRVGAEPVSTHNPFAANPADLVNDSQGNGHSYYSGAADVQNVVNDTSQLPAVTKSIRDDANLDSGFGTEQAEAPDPACDADGEATDNSTICWLIEDGSGPNDHRP
jgi:hypothetical protein